MRPFAIVIALCAAGFMTGPVRAGETASAPLPLQVNLRKEDAGLIVPRYTAFVTMARMPNNKFAFLVPEAYLIRGDPKSGTLTLANPQGSCSITFTVLDSESAVPSPLSADDFRESVLRDYTDGKIIQEFSGGAAGGTGPGFDLQWKASGGIVECKRVMYVPSSAGVLRFTATASRDDFEALKSTLGGLLMTFRYSTNGVLKIAPLPSDS